MDRREQQEKDKLWERLLDMQLVGMTRADLNNDNGIVSDQLEKSPASSASGSRN